MSEEDKTIVVASGAVSAERQPQRLISAPKATLFCTDSSQIDGTPADFKILLEKDAEVIVGRDETCPCCVPSRKLSRKHARLFAGSGAWGVEDLHSTNGVFVNGQRVTTAWLKHEDEVRFGPISFRFSLDRPDLASAVAQAATAATAAKDAEDEASEKTMMFGSLKASEAVLKAVNQAAAEPEPQTAKAETVAARVQLKNAPPPKTSKLPLIGGAVAAALVLGGVVGFLLSGGHEDIDHAIARSGKVADRTIAAVRESPPQEVLNRDFSTDLAALVEPAGEVDRLVAEEADDLGLINAAAKLAFLRFERELAVMVAERRLDDAQAAAEKLKARLAKLGQGIPAGTRDAELEDYRSVSDLAQFAEILVQFRKFTAAYPEVGGQPEPSVAAVNAINARKADFSKYRRAQNKALSVYYIVFRNMVNDVEDRDFRIINGWKQHADSRAG